MLRIGAKLFRTARIGGSVFGSSQLPPPRFFSINNNVNTSFKTNPVALQMINYALSLARSQKSDESYAQAQLVLEQCHSAQLDESAKGLVLIAMSTLFSERGNFGEAIEKLQKVQDLGLSSLAVKVAASEALAGLYLESHQDDHSSATAEICLQLLETIRLEIGGGGSEFLEARAKALKGLVELVRGNVESGNYHPKVGIILTCIALMYRHKAAMERSSSLLIQEGLYRRAIEVLKAPPLEIEGVEAKLSRRDILALARGGYAETLIVQQNRKAEGEKMKQWAEKAWTNRRLSLAEALEPSESSTKVAVIDTRISRVL